MSNAIENKRRKVRALAGLAYAYDVAIVVDNCGIFVSILILYVIFERLVVALAPHIFSESNEEHPKKMEKKL